MVNLTILQMFFLVFAACLAAMVAWMLILAGQTRRIKEKVSPRSKPRTGRVLYREIISGIEGITNSYVAEIRLIAKGDIRFQIYDINDYLILESRPTKICGVSDMVRQYMSDIVKKKIKSLGDADG